MLLLVSITCNKYIFSQVEDTELLIKLPNYDTNYVVSFRDDLVVTLVSEYKVNELEVPTTINYPKHIVYTTNNTFVFGFGLDYKWITFEYLTQIKGIDQDPNKGKSENSSIGFGLTMRKFWFRNFYEWNKGYHVANYKDFYPELQTIPYREDITTSIYYATINYGFNHYRFSNMASMWQLERQQKSAGSFTAGVTFAYTEMNADSSLVSYDFEQFVNDTIASIKRYRTRVYGINFGYLHTFALSKNKKWFVSLALIPGFSYQNITVNGEGEGESNSHVPGFQGEARVSLGYNGDKWYYGIVYRAYNITNNIHRHYPTSQIYDYFRFYFGYRFTMPETKSKFFKKLGL
jgi:hypothetical protein